MSVAPISNDVPAVLETKILIPKNTNNNENIQEKTNPNPPEHIWVRLHVYKKYFFLSTTLRELSIFSIII